MSAYKEIVTKAVVGKGKKYYRNTYTINTEFAPNTVLGCWVINHKFEGHEVHGKIEIDGSFDVNLWYSYRYGKGKKNSLSKITSYYSIH